MMHYKTLGAIFITQLALGDGYSGVDEMLQETDETIQWDDKHREPYNYRFEGESGPVVN